MLQNRYKPLSGGGSVSVSSVSAAATASLAFDDDVSSSSAAAPRRSVSVNHLARQLQSHTRVSPQVMVTPSRQVNHNNNRPFSYLSPHQAVTNADHQPASDEDEGLEIDSAYKPRQVSFSNKYRQVFFSEDDFPKGRYNDDPPPATRKSYEDDTPKKRFGDDDFTKKRYEEDTKHITSKRYDDEVQLKKKSYDDLSLKKRYESDEAPRKRYENGRSSGGHRYLSEQSSSGRDVVDSGIENDHHPMKQRTRAPTSAERTSSRVSERTSSRVSTLRRDRDHHNDRDSPAMQSARLVQQANKSSSPRRRSLSILDEDGHDASNVENNRTKTIEKEKKKRRLRLKNFFIRDKNKNNEETKEVKSSTLKRNQTRDKSSSRHLEPSDTDQASADEVRPLSSSNHKSSSGNHHHYSNHQSSSSSSQQQQQQRRPVKRSSSMHTTHAPPPAPTSRRAASRSGSSVLDAPKSWFKTVDRFTFRTSKNNNTTSHIKSNGGKSAPAAPHHHHHEVAAEPVRRVRRSFDDTDPESAPEPATLERRHFKPRQKAAASAPSSSGPPAGARRGVQQRQNRLLANSSEESENDPKPMYLHNAAVVDIPGRLGPRRTVSREELAAQKPTRHLSRSFSVLAPWRPSRYQGNQEIYYQNEGSASGDKFHSKPPRGPNRGMTASIESLGGSGSSLERGRTSKYKSRTNVNGL